MDWNKVIKIIKKLIRLPPLPTICISVPSFVFVFYVLANQTTIPMPIAYASYILSAYAMVISVTGSFGIVKWIQEGFQQHPTVKKLFALPFIEQFFSEKQFRAEVSLYPSLLINLLYAGIKLFSGIYYHSVWFGTLAVYYMLLAVMRFSLLHQVRGRKKEDRISELKSCRLCGMILMILDWALTGMIVLVISKNSGFEYPGMMIYLMALYTFYAVITAIVNVIKFRNYESPVIAVAKVLNLTAGLVSMFSLETAMLTQFGKDGEAGFRQRMTMMTGTGVSLLVLAMAIWTLVRTTNLIRKEEKR